ncbi:MAG: SAM-dependent methyltransferase [Thermoanaerobaculia bacterium]
MTATPVAGSFRDPSGFVYRRDGVLYRQINRSYRPDYEKLLSSGLYDALVKSGLLVAHREAPLEVAANAEAFRVIIPELVPFISYPWEWSFSQLRDAALATLESQRVALDHGMILKDAAAFNVQFRGSKPVLIDTLSFEELKEGEPWVGYGQFCRHFLAPLALMAHVDVRLQQLLRVYIDGIPLDLARSLLPSRKWWDPSLLMHINVHGAMSSRVAGSGIEVKKHRRKMSLNALYALTDSLAKAVRSLRWTPAGEWSDYYEDPEMTSDEATGEKAGIVESLIGSDAGVVWDIGSNTGLYSNVAEKSADLVISIDGDPGAVERNYLALRSRGGEKIIPLLVDFSNPTPALGWSSSERESLLGRGPADTTLALAVVHHFAISNNVPLERLSDFFSAATRRTLIIEFVPKSDEKVRILLRNRRDIFDTYDEEHFRTAFERHFRIAQRAPLPGTDRVLFRMERS